MDGRTHVDHGLESPDGKKTYLTAAFPSQCGKTNLAMLVPPEHYLKLGWKTTLVGDDIAWLWPGKNRKAACYQPGNGILWRCPRTSGIAIRCNGGDEEQYDLYERGTY